MALARAVSSRSPIVSATKVFLRSRASLNLTDPSISTPPAWRAGEEVFSVRAGLCGDERELCLRSGQRLCAPGRLLALGAVLGGAGGVRQIMRGVDQRHMREGLGEIAHLSAG